MNNGNTLPPYTIELNGTSSRISEHRPRPFFAQKRAQKKFNQNKKVKIDEYTTVQTL